MKAGPWIVVGGGISGLLAAWRLQERGEDVELWEASDAPGGLARTLPWPGPDGAPGFLERGPQGFLVSRGSALEAVLAQAGVATHRPGPRGPRWLAKGGRLQAGPTTLRGLIQAPGMTVVEKLRLLAEPFIPAAPGGLDTLHTFFTRRLGAGFARELLPALVAGIFAAPPERIGLEAVSRLARLEARGGLFLGGLREGAERTVLARGGTGALATALVSRLPQVRLRCPALALEALAEGGWRVRGPGGATRDAAQVVLALPAAAASALLRPWAPGAAAELAALPCLDLTVWHSRHPMVPGWERGFGLLVHPPEGRGLLGAVSLAATDPRAASGLLQVRAYVGGAYPTAPALEAWPGVFAELLRWLPRLQEPVQVRAEAAPEAFPVLGPGHGAQAERIQEALPQGLHWLGAARFGPGLKDLTAGAEAWIRRI